MVVVLEVASTLWGGSRMLATPGYLTDCLLAQMKSRPCAVTFISRVLGSGAFWASLVGDDGLGELPCELWGGHDDGVKTKLSLLLPTLPVARRGYERVVENGVVSSINETKG